MYVYIYLSLISLKVIGIIWKTLWEFISFHLQIGYEKSLLTIIPLKTLKYYQQDKYILSIDIVWIYYLKYCHLLFIYYEFCIHLNFT